MFVLSAPGATLDSRRIANVEAQFANLQYHGEALSWHRAGVADDATATASPCKHYQGGARDPRPGPAYFYFTRNGNPSGACAGASTDPGEFVVVKLASREGDGEALRSNRLRRGEAQENTQPIAADRAVAHIRFDGVSTDPDGKVWPAFAHPGGIQMLGDHLVAVGLSVRLDVEDGFGTNCGNGICLIDVSDPSQPRRAFFQCWKDVGAVAIDRRPDGLIQILTAGASWWLLTLKTNDTGGFECSPTSPVSGNCGYDFFYDRWQDFSQFLDPNVQANWEEWQSIQFIRQQDGTLYLLCLDNKTTGLEDDEQDVAALFKFTYGRTNAPIYWQLEFIAKRTFKTGDPYKGDFNAVGAFHVTPSGELLMYMAEHRDGSLSPGDTVQMGEWRSKNLFEVGPQQDCTAWVQLYQNVNGDTGPQLTVNYRDYLMDDYEDLHNLRINAGDVDGWGNRARAVRWFAPPGGTIRLNQNRPDGPAGKHLDLLGNGTVQFISNLSSVTWTGDSGNPSAQISGVEFLGAACGSPVVYVPDFAPTYSSVLPWLNAFSSLPCNTLSFAEGTHTGVNTIGGPGKRVTVKARGGRVVLRP